MDPPTVAKLPPRCRRSPGPQALRHAMKPERVLCYSRRTTVAWAALDPRLQGVRGLSDILRLDLEHFCRHAPPLGLGLGIRIG